MSDWKKWPLEQFPIVFKKIAEQGSGYVEHDDLKWAPQSARIRLHHYLHRVRPDLLWRIDVGEVAMVVSSRPRGPLPAAGQTHTNLG